MLNLNSQYNFDTWLFLKFLSIPIPLVIASEDFKLLFSLDLGFFSYCLEIFKYQVKKKHAWRDHRPKDEFIMVSLNLPGVKLSSKYVWFKFMGIINTCYANPWSKKILFAVESHESWILKVLTKRSNRVLNHKQDKF